MRWECQRDCGSSGEKRYGSAADARRYARNLDVEDRSDIGRRAPLLGMFPLRAYRAWRGRRM